MIDASILHSQTVLLTVAAAVSLAASVGLGFVARRAPVGIDADVAAATLGHATPLAWRFTNLGYARDLGALYVVLGILGIAFDRSDLKLLAVLAIAQILSQLGANALKDVFKRERPERWLRRQESTASYPSGHATTAVVTFAGLAFVAATTSHVPHAAGVAVAAASIACALGIPWSRLALGAHYLSDVAGGVLLGAGTLALVAAFVAR